LSRWLISLNKPFNLPLSLSGAVLSGLLTIKERLNMSITMQRLDSKYIVKVDGQVVAVCWCWQDAYTIINGRQGRPLKEGV
jgi:hypothetical protein